MSIYKAAYIVAAGDTQYDLSVEFTNADVEFKKPKTFIEGTKGKKAEYTVQEGDTQQKVTEEFAWTDQKALFQAMQELHPSPGIKPGEKIFIPGHDYK
jgi:hypothetical protein